MESNDKLAALKEFRANMGGKNAFELLGVGMDADDAAVRKAYFECIRKYGADFFQQETDPEARQAIDDVNRQLRLAYDAIGREDKRTSYLAMLHGEAVPTEAPVDIEQVFLCEQAVAQARTLMDRGDFEIARQKLRKAREMDPLNTEIRVRCGYLDFMLMPTDERGKRHSGEVGQIRQELEEACKELATADYLRVYLGDLEKLEGNLEAAQKWYEEALKLNAGNLPAQRALRLMKDREKKTKEAQAPAGSWLDRIKSLLTKKL